MKFFALSSIALLLTQQVLAKPAEGCLQNYTITDTDSCVSVSAQFQITEAAFYAMNPGLHHSVQHDCDNLDTGKPFCVCMQSPCPVESVSPAASSVEANSTVPITHVTTTSTESTSATIVTTSVSVLPSSLVSSSVTASSSVPSSSAPSSSAPSSTAITSTTPSSSVSASAQTSTTSKSAASMTTAISAISIGLVMTATAMLL